MIVDIFFSSTFNVACIKKTASFTPHHFLIIQTNIFYYTFDLGMKTYSSSTICHISQCEFLPTLLAVKFLTWRLPIGWHVSTEVSTFYPWQEFLSHFKNRKHHMSKHLTISSYHHYITINSPTGLHVLLLLLNFTKLLCSR